MTFPADSPADPLNDEQNRLTILLVEDNVQYAANALKAFAEHEVMHATTLEQALRMLREKKVDYIISDVHFPASDGEEPKESIGGLLFDALERNIPICFITQADHHGLTELGDEGYIAFCALNINDLAKSTMKIAGGKEEEAGLFRLLESQSRRTLRVDSKTPGMWNYALDLLRNACTKSGPIGKAIERVRGLGLSVTAERGMIRVVAPRNGKK